MLYLHWVKWFCISLPCINQMVPWQSYSLITACCDWFIQGCQGGMFLHKCFDFIVCMIIICINIIKYNLLNMRKLMKLWNFKNIVFKNKFIYTYFHFVSYFQIRHWHQFPIVERDCWCSWEAGITFTAGPVTFFTTLTLFITLPLASFFWKIFDQRDLNQPNNEVHCVAILVRMTLLAK